MLRINNLEKAFGAQELFSGVSMQMNPGERLGLVGRNGSGKSTLFRMILGKVEYDVGEIQVPKNYRLGHLEQHLKFSQPNILAETCLGLPDEAKDLSYQAERILFGLGFSQEDLAKAPEEFSGGYQIRINLAKVLVSQPNLLLLDEPTNYLDILSIRWMKQFLRQWPGELILISHDREFMDAVITHTAILHRGGLRKIAGRTEKLYQQILQEEEIHEKTRLNQEKKLKQEREFIDRFRAKASKAKAVQSRLKRLAKLPSLDKLAHLDQLDFNFHYAPFQADRMMEIKGVNFAYDPVQPLIQKLSDRIKPGERIGVIGKNGRGKSTLLRLLAGELSPQSGQIQTHPATEVGYFGQTNIDRLHPELTIEQEVASANPALGITEVRTLCGTMMFSGDQVEKTISVLSGGERSRVLLAKILAHPCNLLLLDEPTNHLDMESIEALLDSLAGFPGTLVMVTHSEMILKDLVTRLLVFQREGLVHFNGGYEEFLEKVGWEEEEGTDSKEASGKAPASPNKKELRKLRGQIIAERSKTLGPLKKEMEEQEAKIVAWEESLKQLRQDMIHAAEAGDSKQLADLGFKIRELEKRVEAGLDQWGAADERHRGLSESFEERLKKLD